MQRSLLRILVIPLMLVLMGQGCGGPSSAEIAANTPVTLKIWRVFDDDDTFREIMNNYRAIHPNVSFEYRELRFDEYEEELVRAFAEGTGPDIFSLHNTWIGEYESLITPMPDSVNIPYCETRGTIKKETVCVLQEEPTVSLRALRNDFVDVVADDVIRSYRPTSRGQTEERIFALPLFVDTLALYYNRDLLNAASLPQPPSTWSQFQDQVTELTRVGSDDKILQAGAALGTSRNVERAFDIVSLLMLQNGSQMIDDRGRAVFARGDDDGLLATQAVRFYTDFANPLKAVYTWNEDMSDSFDAFTSGSAAFFLGYAYHHELIEAASEKLNLGIAPLPQIEGGRTVNYANYWVETVSKSTDDPSWAWDFVEFAASEDQVTSYLNTAEAPTALRSLINTQAEDEVLSVFAGQTLTAESWYRGDDVSIAEEAFLDLIDAFLADEDAEDALTDAQNKVNQSI